MRPPVTDSLVPGVCRCGHNHTFHTQPTEGCEVCRCERWWEDKAFVPLGQGVVSS